MLKGIQKMFQQNEKQFDPIFLSRIKIKKIQIIISKNLKKIKQQLSSNKKQNKNYLISAFNIFVIQFNQLTIIKTPLNQFKLSILNYTLNWMNTKIAYKDNQLNQIKIYLQILSIITLRHYLIQKNCNCSFLYQSLPLIPQMFEIKKNNPQTCTRMPLFTAAITDSSLIFKSAVHLPDNELLYKTYRQKVLFIFQTKYVNGITMQIEDWLRINVHIMLIDKIQGIDPFSNEIKDFKKLLQLNNRFKFFDYVVDMKKLISQKLNETFYNINVINIYDMQTYQQIRILGNYVFGLSLLDPHLPHQTIEQQMFDILQIIRNIPAFVQKYKYNVFTQTFIEETNQSKTVSSIGITQLSDSIRTHGIGIMPTTVNIFYKYITRQITQFSKFLFNDQIKILLTKQIKFFKQFANRDDYPGYYPYQRSEYLQKEIKKLGLVQHGKTILDKFRILITSIGNVLGFVRLLRSACLRYTSKSIEFLPKLQIVKNFENLTDTKNLSQHTKQSCKQLDDILKSLNDNFSEKTDYLKILVKSFEQILTKQNKHLKNFFIIVPALTINYISNIITGKQQLQRRNTIGGFITDQGFILGLSYFLTLLKQSQNFLALNWEESVKEYYKQQKGTLKQNIEKSKGERVNQQITMERQFSFKKLQAYSQQFEIFYYTLTSAGILFMSQ